MHTLPHISLSRRPAGYILPFVLLLLTALMVASAGFFYRATDSTKLSGTERDYDQALLLAESGANRILGRYFNKSTITYPLTSCAGNTMVGDMNCDGTLDDAQAKPQSFATPNLVLGYEFYLTAGAGIDQTAAGILQKVANGEARASGTSLNSRAVPTGTTYLRVNDLFVDGTIRPFLYTQSNAGLTRSSNTWNSESAAEKVAVWLEVSKNPEPANSQWFDLYICSVAQVGNAKAYLQRYMGSYTDLLGNAVIAPLSESATHG